MGRRLGYPLKLVTTKGHLFVRWEDAHERFNIEAAGKGVNRFTDDYYRHWPLEVTPAEEAAEGYLKSLTPPEELAVFLSIRGMCLREAGRLPEAAEAFAAAARLAPACRGYQVMLASLQGPPCARSSCSQAPSRTSHSQTQQPEFMKTNIITKAAAPALVLIAWLLLPQTGQCFYNPSTGRWLSRDPIEESGGDNVYPIRW